MFNSIVLDSVIGLVFIFLLYSLLATILGEMIANWLGLRARMLRQANSLAAPTLVVANASRSGVVRDRSFGPGGIPS